MVGHRRNLGTRAFVGRTCIVQTSLGEGEARRFQSHVAEVQTHTAPRGDLPGLVEVAVGGSVVARVTVKGRASQEATRQVVLLAGPTEPGHGAVEVPGRLGWLAESVVRATKRQMVEGRCRGASPAR